jgi:hypothetical protein
MADLVAFLLLRSQHPVGHLPQAGLKPERFRQILGGRRDNQLPFHLCVESRLASPKALIPRGESRIQDQYAMPAANCLWGEHPMVRALACRQDERMKNIGFSNTELSASARLPAPAARLKPTAVAVRTRRDEVARKAYFIYLNQGCPEGRDVQHWLAAEAQMTAPTKAVAATSLR